ncbi:MAG: PAS domain-containing protein [Spirochaetales bacterium]|nr:PAS domain-containing protein [Spirochaetales bacterium]
MNSQDRPGYTVFLDFISQPVCVCNAGCSVIYANQAMHDVFGNPDSSDVFSYLRVSEEMREHFKCTHAKTNKTMFFVWVPEPPRSPYEVKKTCIAVSSDNTMILFEFGAIECRDDTPDNISKSRSSLVNEIQQGKDRLLQAGKTIRRNEHDIREKEDKITRQERILENIFANTHLLIAYLDPQFRIIRANKAFAAVTGRNMSAIEGELCFDILPAVELKEAFAAVLNSGQAMTMHNQKLAFGEKPDFSGMYWDWSLQPVANKQNLVVGLILIMTDVTKRVESERQLSRANRKLAEARRLSDIGTLAATVAHELRNPLGVMAAAVFNINRKSKEKSIRKHVRNIDKKIRESQQIINNLLNYARIKKPARQRIHIYHLINECIEDAGKQFSLKKTDIVRDYEELKELMIFIDPFQIREVLSNLLNNAFQASAENAVRVIRISGRLEKESVKINIADNGTGIKPEHMDKVFRPFFTLKPKGTGLGLTICRDMVEMHNGDLGISSAEGKGTTAYVVLPVGENRDFYQ